MLIIKTEALDMYVLHKQIADKTSDKNQAMIISTNFYMHTVFESLRYMMHVNVIRRAQWLKKYEIIKSFMIKRFNLQVYNHESLHYVLSNTLKSTIVIKENWQENYSQNWKSGLAILWNEQ